MQGSISASAVEVLGKHSDSVFDLGLPMLAANHYTAQAYQFYTCINGTVNVRSQATSHGTMDRMVATNMQRCSRVVADVQAGNGSRHCYKKGVVLGRSRGPNGKQPVATIVGKGGYTIDGHWQVSGTQVTDSRAFLCKGWSAYTMGRQIPNIIGCVQRRREAQRRGDGLGVVFVFVFLHFFFFFFFVDFSL